MLISKFGNATEKSILQLSANIPADYKTFLLNYNGGESPETSFSINGVVSDIVGFYGVGNVKYSFNGQSVLELGDNHFLAIAFDSYGNNILLSLSDGTIVFYDHESSALTELAKSFRDFIPLIQSKLVDPKHIKSVEQREQEMIQRGKGERITDSLRSLWKAEIDKYSAIKQEEVQI